MEITDVQLLLYRAPSTHHGRQSLLAKRVAANPAPPALNIVLWAVLTQDKEGAAGAFVKGAAAPADHGSNLLLAKQALGCRESSRYH